MHGDKQCKVKHRIWLFLQTGVGKAPWIRLGTQCARRRDSAQLTVNLGIVPRVEQDIKRTGKVHNVEAGVNGNEDLDRGRGYLGGFGWCTHFDSGEA